MEQARDFLDESEALAAILTGLADADFEQPTQFKGWTINDVLVHLHFWNRGADQALTDPPAFEAATGRLMKALAGSSLRGFENGEITERGTDLLNAWQTLYRDMGARWEALDPKQRVKWVGPDMSVRSSMTARQMETWAHGQEIFDLLGFKREERDRIRNIVVLGVNTFGWAFKVRGAPVPDEMPHLTLTLPSGATAEYGESGNANRIAGSAVAFAQVVTQTRNVADTDLSIEGPIAREWMENAQCFAGPPETPPAPGTRFRIEA
ncbi:TIGR03084 family metal-binding protein [Hoeflea prorocentri]|uniref:TIGR03084 family metal-binding protein n=1 Tax=Hoeflea prorocentri TaxID=1922333 RepID=A0A9X3UKF9_9HYPH|nr:TIGR03084 family metal-binding protein [Hoeflea prorocentri]MCY6382478.1 TIGR03084 family metal-binding protein [Hoeflea prorocentri]MDA5400278.1 TIGR03084 family metal-binding protein [Hoeflea prorocentri]